MKSKKKIAFIGKPVFHRAGVYKDLKDAIRQSGGNLQLAKARMAAQELGQELHKQQGKNEK